jgi:hypothetical protein
LSQCSWQLPQVLRHVSETPSYSQRLFFAFATHPQFLTIVLPSSFVTLNLSGESTHSEQVPHAEGHIRDKPEYLSLLHRFLDSLPTHAHDLVYRLPWCANLNLDGESVQRVELPTFCNGGAAAITPSIHSCFVHFLTRIIIIII